MTSNTGSNIAWWTCTYRHLVSLQC